MSEAQPEMSPLQQYIHTSRYARWLPEKERRETWGETVDRYVDFFEEHIKENTKGTITSIKKELHDAILNMEVMPSMRSMMNEKILQDTIVLLWQWILLAHLMRLFIFS
jgi:hypothetical protein